MLVGVLFKANNFLNKDFLGLKSFIYKGHVASIKGVLFGGPSPPDQLFTSEPRGSFLCIGLSSMRWNPKSNPNLPICHGKFGGNT